MRRMLGLVVVALLGAAVQARALCVEGTVTSCSVNGQPGTRECVNGQWTPCLTEDPPDPPPAPPVVTSRTDSRLTVLWNGAMQAGEAYQLQHWTGAQWSTLISVATGTTFTHSNLPRDTKKCYRVRSVNAGKVSGAACGFTTDGSTRRTWRVQIELRTADVADAGTDDSVSVALNEWSIGAGSNLTWLDYGGADRRRGAVLQYDLNLDDIPLFSDINRIRLAKVGTDPWCVAGFRLLVNERAVYDRDFGAEPSGCRWIDTGDDHFPTFTVDHATLRGHALWQDYEEPLRVSFDPTQNTATVRIPRAETESRIEGLIGHLIHGSRAHWGERYGRAYVEADPGGETDRLRVDLDLEATVDAWFDPELDIDFDLRYEASCSLDGLVANARVTTENLEAHADFDWMVEVLASMPVFYAPCYAKFDQSCISEVEDHIAAKLEDQFTPIVQAQSQVLPPGYRCLSAQVAIDDDADVRLIYSVQPPITGPWTRR